MARGGKSRKRIVLATLGVVGALVFAGCDWPMFGFDAAHTGFSPDRAMNSANVSTVQPLFTVPAQSDPIIPGQFGPPVESNGVVYAGSTSAGGTSGNLEAFDANGATNCSGSSNQCSPLWTAPPAPTLQVLEVGALPPWPTASSTSPRRNLQRPRSRRRCTPSDRGWVTNCSGTPKVCQPLWTAPLSTGDIHVESPNVTNGVVYVSGYQSPGGIPPQDQPVRSRPSTPTGSPTARARPRCASRSGRPPSNIGFSSPAVANGVLYAVGEDTLDAFSANGTTNCSGTPTTCNPLWTATLYSHPRSSYRLAHGVERRRLRPIRHFNLYAFSANGTTSCSGTPKTCTPLWTAGPCRTRCCGQRHCLRGPE